MAHCVVPEAEKILDKEFRVLDKGFIRLVDYLGSDDRIVQAARVSYGEGTKSYREDAGLIDYLLRHEHTSPFEQVVLTFHVKLPVFVARQWIRHRTARVNEMSGRYSIMKDEFYVPDASDLATQSPDNKQGRSDERMTDEQTRRIIYSFEREQKNSYEQYTKYVEEENLAREIARINLPLSLYTEWYWQIDLHNLFHFLMLRLDPHAQKEIRLYAEILLDISRAVAPRATESFERHTLGAVHFSKTEMEELKRRLAESATKGKATEVSLEGKALERFEEKLRTGRQL
jgi:thymidylate synthase (FAD)